MVFVDIISNIFRFGLNKSEENLASRQWREAALLVIVWVAGFPCLRPKRKIATVQPIWAPASDNG